MSAYEPEEVESKWRAFWEEGEFFKADPTSSKKPYCISIPPPNVTGVLHMGHALVDTLQDVLVRWKRMSGYEALWVPGTDHAGIATQTVVERDQIARTGKRRVDFERDEFVKLIWEWKEKSERRILDQLRALGCSCDWSRLAFTMDEERSRATKAAFKKMYDEGLIYRGDYLVNWDPVTQTALADDEVEYEEKQSHLWHMRYPLKDGSGEVVVATTRPETMLGDTAVAVHPEDERYRAMVGKMILHPFTSREIPILADPFVEPEFGTGAVKITPAHDPNDYEMGLRHDLKMINMMTPDGKINELGKEFAGLTMLEGRLALVEWLKGDGFIVKIEEHTHRVGVSYRSKAVIEPYLSKQWFVSMQPFKEKLIQAVKEGRCKIIPKDWESTYFHWIENLRDWCISRQLWWGHQIPVYYRRDNPDEMMCHIEGDEPDPSVWVQDPDVLDTWFSSAVWPLSVLGWPEKTPDLEAFYPNSVLVTGHDILFFWVARMLMMGEYLVGELPFPETFLHGLIFGKSYWRMSEDGAISYVSKEEHKRFDLGEKLPRGVNAKWEKMSKSKGNVIDPLEISESYGTDAMRIALCSVATHARQIDLDRRRFEEFKNFINKIYNGARFVFMNIEDLTSELFGEGIDRELLQLEDRWILSRLNGLCGKINELLGCYNFAGAAHATYHFFWDEFCASYLEIAKPVLFGKAGSPELKRNKQRILAVVLSNLLRLFHPMIPFVTEELFQKLKEMIPGGSSDEPYVKETIEALKATACTVAPYPKVIEKSDIELDAEEAFNLVGGVIAALRNIRGEMQLPPKVPTDLVIEAEGRKLEIVRENTALIHALVPIEEIIFNETSSAKGFTASGQVDAIKVTVPLPESMREKELIRLRKLQEKLIAQQNGLRAKLGNDAFTANAPPELVKKTEELLTEIEAQLADIGEKLSS